MAEREVVAVVLAHDGEAATDLAGDEAVAERGRHVARGGARREVHDRVLDADDPQIRGDTKRLNWPHTYVESDSRRKSGTYSTVIPT